MSQVNSLVNDLLESSDEIRDVPNSRNGEGADQDAQNKKALDNPNYNTDNTDTLTENTDPEDDADVFSEEGDLPDPEEQDALDEDFTNLVAMDTAYAILSEDMSPEILTEARNIVRLNKRTRLNNLTTRTSLVMARRKKDPLFVKYAKFNGLRLAIREKIVKKYGSKATAYSRKLMNRTSTAGNDKK